MSLLHHRPIDRRIFLKGSVALLGGASPWVSSAIAAIPQDNIPQDNARKSTGERWTAATVNRFATDIAAQILRSGGNAMDAAIAASFMLAVVDGHNSGIGGGGFALLRTPDGKVIAIDGREEAPSGITPQHFIRDGKADPQLSQLGPLAVAIPGQVAALWEMHQRFGSTPWQRLVEPAAELAKRGFAFGRLSEVIADHQMEIKQFPETAKILMPDGRVPAETDRLVQADLAQTLQSIAQEGRDGFYTGIVPQKIATHLQAMGGVVAVADFDSYKAKNRTPIETNYRGNQVFGFPPPSSGGVHIAQMLEMLSPFDLVSIRNKSEADYRHLLLEVMKRAMADRAHWLGDADYVNVPARLVDPGYLKERMADFRFDKATNVQGHGIPPEAQSQFFGNKHTTHLTTADAAGNVVAMTQTVNTSFGSKMIAPGTGVILNNQMDDFSLAPGVRNAFGLIGSQANAVEPGKRPLSSMSPTIAIDSQGNCLVTCGAAGGPRIITATLQNLLGVLDFKYDMNQAITDARVHHQWSPNRAVVEKLIPENVVSSLRDRGHKVEAIDASAVAQGISFHAKSMTAASDPRTDGSALSE